MTVLFVVLLAASVLAIKVSQEKERTEFQRVSRNLDRAAVADAWERDRIGSIEDPVEREAAKEAYRQRKADQEAAAERAHIAEETGGWY